MLKNLKTFVKEKEYFHLGIKLVCARSFEATPPILYVHICNVMTMALSTIEHRSLKRICKDIKPP